MPRRYTYRLKRSLRRKQKGGKSMNAFDFSTSKFKNYLHVRFNRDVDGGSFKKEYVQEAPVITWNKPPVNNTFHSYICFDPDSTIPSWIHLMILNCKTEYINSGTTVFEWTPPAPAPGTGEHRYIFGLFGHSYPINTENLKDRGGFDIKSFYEKNGLVPVAGAFMKVSATE